MTIDVSSEKYDQHLKSKGSQVARTFERIFYKIGYSIAGRPFTYILVTSFVAIVCSLGLLKLKFESRPERLWLPADSDYVEANKWKSEHFTEWIRRELILLESEDNILQPKYFKHIYYLNKEILNIQVYYHEENRYVNTSELCLDIPEMGRIQENLGLDTLSWMFGESSQIDVSLYLDTETYCDIFNNLPRSCFFVSILEMWILDDEMIESMTQDDIIHAVNTVTNSATYGFPLDFSRLLGNITRNSTGHIIGAQSTLAVWVMEAKISDSDVDEDTQAAVTAGEIDMKIYEWEGQFIKTILKFIEENDLANNLYPQTRRSFADMSAESVRSDIPLLIIGNVVLYTYVIIMLGKFNLVESRILLSLLGFISIYMSVFASFGVCSILGIVYAPLQSFLPLIMVGLGVDDMFVIMQSWENQQQHAKGSTKKDLRTRMAETLQKSGVAIFVTSLTDFMAFIIGSLTSLPALRSFCLYSAIGVAFLFISQITFFFAWFALDQQRLEDNRNGLFWFMKHDNWTPNKFSEMNTMKNIFNYIADFILNRRMKIFIIILTVAMSLISVWGVSSLRQFFDPLWFLSESSYLFKFLDRAFKYFPDAGAKGFIYLEGTAANTELDKVRWLTEQLEENDNLYRVTSFYDKFVNYTLEDRDFDISNKNLNESMSSELLGKFLFSRRGVKFLRYLALTEKPKCGFPAPPLTAVKLEYTHKNLPNITEKIKAMEEVKEILKNANFSGFSTAMSHSYMTLESDKIIVRELIQNLLLALLAVFIMTTILIANITTSFFVFSCVLLTVIDVLALMSWWGLSIDTVTTIHLVLCVGLSVDYSAHIGLHFMKASGSNTERAKAALVEIGPAILNGAISTFLAFTLFSKADSHVFSSFFKIFFGVFFFGIYKGIIFLPVVLDLFGPASYDISNMKEKEIQPLNAKDNFLHENTKVSAS